MSKKIQDNTYIGFFAMAVSSAVLYFLVAVLRISTNSLAVAISLFICVLIFFCENHFRQHTKESTYYWFLIYHWWISLNPLFSCCFLPFFTPFWMAILFTLKVLDEGGPPDPLKNEWFIISLYISVALTLNLILRIRGVSPRNLSALKAFGKSLENDQKE